MKRPLLARAGERSPRELPTPNHPTPVVFGDISYQVNRLLSIPLFA
jgi:hypothetical protein